MPAVNHNELRKVLHKYKNILSERESLKLVLTRSLDISKFKSWILQDKNRVNKYCNSQKTPIDLTKSDEKIVGRLCERIYSMRCTIANAKGDVDEYIAVPTVSDSEIGLEIELIKYVAYEALKACSEIKVYNGAGVDMVSYLMCIPGSILLLFMTRNDCKDHASTFLTKNNIN